MMLNHPSIEGLDARNIARKDTVELIAE